MTEREKLIELLDIIIQPGQKTLGDIADYLLANGVIVPPCKVGDEVYVIYAGYVATAKVLALYIDYEGGMFDLQIKTKDETTVGFKTVIDKDNYTFSDVFHTKEEAEKALHKINHNSLCETETYKMGANR